MWEIFNVRHLTLQTMQTKSGQCLYTSCCYLGSGWVLELNPTFSQKVLQQLFSISHNRSHLEVLSGTSAGIPLTKLFGLWVLIDTLSHHSRIPKTNAYLLDHAHFS